MPTVSALKLIDRALLPIVVLVAAKLLGIFLACLIFGIGFEYRLSATVNNFLFLQFSSREDLSVVINFSDIITVLACGLGFSWVLFQANHLNIDKTHPTKISKLYHKGRDFWLTKTGQVDHALSVWLGLSWLVLFLVLVNVYQGLTSDFVLGVSLALTLGLTFGFYEFVRQR